MGSEDLIKRVRKEYLKDREFDRRNIPVAKRILNGPSPKEIEKAVAKVIGEDHSLYRKFCIHLINQYSGLGLEEIGAHFGMKGGAVSQLSQKFKKTING